MKKVLVCGPSNISVDTILERLSPIFNEEEVHTDRKKTRRAAKKSTSAGKNPEKLIRIGHPARLLGAIYSIRLIYYPKRITILDRTITKKYWKI